MNARGARAPQPTPETVIAGIETCAASITALNEQLTARLLERVTLYRQGVELGVPKVAMARAAGCSPEAVIHALSRGKPKM